jgi:hypothetical protein
MNGSDLHRTRTCFAVPRDPEGGPISLLLRHVSRSHGAEAASRPVSAGQCRERHRGKWAIVPGAAGDIADEIAAFARLH